MAINSLSSSSHGLSGLASGMDTQSMVDAMLKGTQNKIDSAKSKKAQLIYKQEMYRSISSQLRTLKSSFFSFTNGSANNMYSTDFFNTMTAKSSSNAFRITAGNGALTGTTKVDYIKQLARAKSLKSTNAAAAKLEGKFNVKGLEAAKEAVKSELTVKIGDTEVTIEDLNKVMAGKGSADAAQALSDELNTLLTGTDKVIKVNFENGEMKFEATNSAGKAQSLNISGKGTKIFAADGNSYSSADGKINKKATLTLLNPSISVTLNGVKKTVTFDYNATDAKGVQESLQIAMDKAFGPEVIIGRNGDNIEFSTKSSTSTLMLQGSDATMKTLGIKTGQSNKINSTMFVGNINFATELMGNNFKFKINGVDFNITADKTLDNIINQINSSDANVKISYSRSDDKFIIESKQMGADVGIEMSQSEGNLLSALFGKEAVAGGGATRGDELYKHTDLTGTYDPDGFLQVKDSSDPSNPDKMKAFTGGSVVIDVNGKQVVLTLPSEVLKDADQKPILDPDGKEQYVPYTAERFKTEINKELEKQFGKTDDGKANISFSVEQDASGNDVLKLSSERGYAVGFSNESSAKMMGFTVDDVTTKAATAETKLGELGLGDDFSMEIKVGGRTITLTLADFGGENATIQEMTDKINETMRANEPVTEPPRPGTYGTAAFDDPPGRFRLFGVDVPMEIVISGGKEAEGLFGGKELSFGDGKADEDKFISTEGKNAILSINGVEVKRNSNVFNYDGLDFELLTTTQKMDANGDPIPDKFDSAIIDVTRDTEKIYEGLSKFVTEYNKVMESINKLLSAEPSYKEYAPLTTEQRAQMSESEAKLWDEKSKEGLLRRDPALEKVMADLRGVLYSKPEDSDLALYNIGIKTFMSYEPNDSGKIRLENDGAELKKAIAERPEDVAKLFLSEKGGLSKGIMDAIDAATKVGTGSQGTLVKIAGSTGSADTTSRIYIQLKEINDSLTNLERTYQSEYTRYWKQFTTMEQMIANMNSQSAWLTQQSGS